MSSFLIDRNSPIRSVNDHPTTRLHHRSRHSTESEPNANDSPQESSKSKQQTPTPMEDSEQKPMDGDTQNLQSKGPSMFSYFKTELTRGYKLEGNATEFVQRRDRIYTSVNTPKSLEKFCAFGLLQCLDSILNVMTFLPLRILVALVHVFTYPCSVIFFRKKAILNPAQICDLLKGVILLVSCFIASYIDTSIVYHIIRGQSIMKFYVVYNMLDVMDKLISGFGQDVLDSLYWTAVEPRGRRREHFGTIFHLMFAIAYVVIHTMLILTQAITLNVAFNSTNKNLLTIMLSSNFIEIKANLSKRLDKSTLCQITYGDVKERFHYLVLLLFVLIHNLQDEKWLRDGAPAFIVDAMIVFGTELIVDWVKHSFITKINEFSASYYGDFAIGLAQDIASSQKKHAFTDFSDQVCRRMGFTPIPLTCLLFIACRKSLEITGLGSLLTFVMLYLCLFTSKVLNSIILLGWAQHLITEGDKNAKGNVTVGNSQVMPKKGDNKAETETKVKTESISHCPDITTSLSQSIATSQSTVVPNDSKPLLSSSASFSSTPLPTITATRTTPRSESPLKMNIDYKEEYVVEDSLHVSSITPITISHHNGNKFVTHYECDHLETEISDKEAEAVTIDKDHYEKNVNIDNHGNDLNAFLQDVSDNLMSLTSDNEYHAVSPASCNIMECMEQKPSPQHLSLEDIAEPHNVSKLLSNSPTKFHLVKDDSCQSKEDECPIHESSPDTLPFSDTDTTILFSKDCDEKVSTLLADTTNSNENSLPTNENVAHNDIISSDKLMES